MLDAIYCLEKQQLCRCAAYVQMQSAQATEMTRKSDNAAWIEIVLLSRKSDSLIVIAILMGCVEKYRHRAHITSIKSFCLLHICVGFPLSPESTSPSTVQTT